MAESNERALKYLSRATELIQQRKYADAVAECDRILRWKSDFAEAYQSRAVANAQLGRTEAAMRDYTQAIRFQPDFPAALEGRGGLFRAADKLEEALGDYNALIKLMPGEARLLRMRAYLHQHLRHLDKALTDIEEALRLDPKNPDAQQDRTRLMERIAAGPVVKPTLAETPIAAPANPGIAAEPVVAALGPSKPVLAAAVPDAAAAPTAPQTKPALPAPAAEVKPAVPLVAMTKAPEAKPMPTAEPRPVTYTTPVLREKWEDALASGRDLEAKRELEKAVAAYMESLRIKDENPEAHYHLGLIYAEQKHFAQALHQFSLAILYRRDYAEAWQGRGNLKLRLGDTLGSKDDLSQAERLTATGPGVPNRTQVR
jgi:tetratricopeptide (TPR) repeat protein